jgi:hypothetical protein
VSSLQPAIVIRGFHGKGVVQLRVQSVRIWVSVWLMWCRFKVGFLKKRSIFEKHIFGVEAIGLGCGEAIVVLAEGGEEIHRIAVEDKFNRTSIGLNAFNVEDVALTDLPTVEWFEIVPAVFDAIQ